MGFPNTFYGLFLLDFVAFASSYPLMVFIAKLSIFLQTTLAFSSRCPG